MKNQNFIFKLYFIFISTGSLKLYRNLNAELMKTDFVTVAVFEHKPISSQFGVNKTEAELIMHQNLDVYERQIQKAFDQVI